MGQVDAIGTLQPNCTAILDGASGGRDEMQLTAATGRRATVAIIDLTPA